MKQIEVLNWAFSILKKYNREENVANILLQHHLGCTKPEFFMNMREAISAQIIDNFKYDIQKHIKTGIPVQHLLGYTYFYGEKFTVNEHTLIPRPETEELIELIIETCPQGAVMNFVDLGTGSGIIAITLAEYFKNAQIYAVDISKEALVVAKNNAKLHDVDVLFFEGNFLEPIIEDQLIIDVIIANPPYIAHADLNSLSDTVRNFDPHRALFADNNGLAAYEVIMQQISYLKQIPKVVCFEIGYNQADELIKAYRKILPDYKVTVKQDINGKDRMLIAEYL